MNKDERSAASTGADTERHRSNDLNPTSAPALSLPPQRLGSAMEGRILPNPGSPEASAMMDSLLTEYQWPAHPKDAARAGWEAANRWLRTGAQTASTAFDKSQLDAMVNRFLGWKLPETFGPDCYVAFDREKAKTNNGWPTGTNLLTADEARAMLEYVLDVTFIPDWSMLKATQASLREHMAMVKELRSELDSQSARQRPGAQAASEPDQDSRWSIDRAADFLEQYAAFIEREKSDDIEQHPYLPELQYVAGQLRGWFVPPAGERPAQAEPTDEQILDVASHYGFIGSQPELLRFCRGLLAEVARERPSVPAPFPFKGPDGNDLTRRPGAQAPSTAACDGGQCGAGGYCKECPLAAPSTGGAETATRKYDDVLLPFLSLMRRELHANSSKGDRPGWLRMDANTALLEVYWHAAKLSAAVKNNDGPAIQEHCADVANMAMMVLDVCGGLAWIDSEGMTHG